MWIYIHPFWEAILPLSGTGSLAQIVFTSITAGTSNLTYGLDCELVTPGDDAIEIKGFGEGVVNAQ